MHKNFLYTKDTAPKLFFKFYNHYLSNAWSYFWRSFCQVKSLSWRFHSFSLFLMLFADVVYLGQTYFNSFWIELLLRRRIWNSLFRLKSVNSFRKKTLYLRCFTCIWMRFCIMVELLKTINTYHIYWCQNKPKVKNDLKHIFNFRLILRVPSRLFQVIWPFATHSVRFYTLDKILLHLL